MLISTLAFLIGVIAGIRSMTAPAMVSWAARSGLLQLSGTWLAFLGYRWTPWIFSLAAVAEIINDKLPNTPSRKVPPQFIARILAGALAGAGIATPSGRVVAGVLLGGIGAVVGTLGGAELRSRLVKATGGRDLPIALLGDVVAVLGAFLIVRQLG